MKKCSIAFAMIMAMRVQSVLIILFLSMTACHSVSAPPDPEPGVSLALATERAGWIQNVRYALSFKLPAPAAEPIESNATVRFSARDTAHALVLDFTPGGDYIRSVLVNGRAAQFRL